MTMKKAVIGQYKRVGDDEIQVTWDPAYAAEKAKVEAKEDEKEMSVADCFMAFFEASAEERAWLRRPIPDVIRRSRKAKK